MGRAPISSGRFKMIINLNYGEIADKAFNNLLGTSGFVKEGVVYGYNDSGEPVPASVTEAQFQLEMNRVRDEVIYVNERKNAYPNIVDQLDKLFHDIDQGKLDKTGEFYKALLHVKTTFPKDGSNNSSIETE